MTPCTELAISWCGRPISKKKKFAVPEVAGYGPHSAARWVAQFFRLETATRRSLTGNISINVQTPETRAQRFANLSLRDIIHGFVHSTYPRFVGKSRKDRIRMALAVYYRAKRGLSFQESTASRMVKTTARRDIIQHFNEYMIAASERNFPYRTKRAVAAANKAPEKTK